MTVRPRRDIDDLDNLFDREEAQRLREDRAAMVETGKARQEMLDQQDAILRATAKESMLKASDVAIIKEYEAAGVAPLKTNGAGVPTCSLSLLLRIGWTVENLGLGVRRLVEPPPPPKWDGYTDRDSLPRKKGKT